MKKVGRNDPCWCGSGLKYKKCHLGRENMPRINPFDYEQKIKKHFGRKYCLHPEASIGSCKGNIVNAHTVQRSGGLSRIAKEGHVYGFKPTMKMMIDNDGKIIPNLIGLKHASTFTGFCSLHDSETFKKLEIEPFSATPEKCFLLAYRAFSRELFTKRADLDSSDIFPEMDAGLSLPIQIEIQSMLKLRKLGSKRL